MVGQVVQATRISDLELVREGASCVSSSFYAPCRTMVTRLYPLERKVIMLYKAIDESKTHERASKHADGGERNQITF